ncbi:hypothetical protein EVD33_15060 [Bacteroidales bacterium SW292]|nr:hypothetical protein [Bacteroidales bacterium SW292]
MEEKMTSNSQVSPEEGRQVTNVVEQVSEKTLIEITGDLSSEDKEFCEKETKQIIDLLSPKQFAHFLSKGLYLIELYGAEEIGKIIVARLAMNRKPKNKSVNVLAETILDVGMLVMLLAIPATVARHFGYEIEDFDGNPIPEDKLCVTVVIIDGQTRYLAIRKLREKYPSLVLSNVYAYFPLHWVGLTKMLQAINLKVFTWTNSDFISGLRGIGLKPEVEKALAYIQSLEQRGYNFTAACEWGTLVKGIIRKTLLVKAMNKPDTDLEYENSEYAMDIHQEARKVFSGKNEDALKNKTIPERIITKWNAICEDLSKKEATAYIKAFLKSLTSDEITEMVSPTDYKRGEGKKKEAFVKEQFEESFQTFVEAHPYEAFRESLKAQGL